MSKTITTHISKHAYIHLEGLSLLSSLKVAEAYVIPLTSIFLCSSCGNIKFSFIIVWYKVFYAFQLRSTTKHVQRSIFFNNLIKFITMLSSSTQSSSTCTFSRILPSKFLYAETWVLTLSVHFINFYYIIPSVITFNQQQIPSKD
jgi:hypothetical protein